MIPLWKSPIKLPVELPVGATRGYPQGMWIHSGYPEGQWVIGFQWLHNGSTMQIHGNPWKSMEFPRNFWEFSGIWAHIGPYRPI